jgi:putative spermidine/putrescine transport system ATP-binding protein
MVEVIADEENQTIKRESFLVFDKVKKTYDQKIMVVKDFNLAVEKGEFVTLLGPSGSGKTTVLMMLAGFESVTNGQILIGGESITGKPAYKRNIGMVFQNYALFPHMTIYENLAYPLNIRKQSNEEVDRTVKESLAMIEMQDFGNRYPGQLSGGQKQRVALARALIFKPDIVLMDEPLGALDKKLREQMQYEITRLHKKHKFTVIYVTHDQTEALTMSTRIAVFNHGKVQQCSTPDELYEKPANAFVAGFIGENNFIDGVVIEVSDDYCSIKIDNRLIVRCKAIDASIKKDDLVRLSIRPEKLYLEIDQEEYNESQKSYFHAEFIVRHYVGDYIRYYFRLANGNEITVKVMNDDVAPVFAEGSNVLMSWMHKDCIAFAS